MSMKSALVAAAAAAAYFKFPNPPNAASRLAMIEHAVFVLLTLMALKGALDLASLGPARAWKKIAGAIFGSLNALPGFDGLVGKGIEKEITQLRKDLLGDGDADAQTAIPKIGLTHAEIREKLVAAKGAAVGYASGKMWGGIYHEESGSLTAVQNEAWGMFNCSNTLYPSTFPGIRKFEAEIVSMTLGLVHGHEAGAVGLLSSGGTESIALAVLAYRNAARAKGITEPEIICGLSAHPALTKACHYYGVAQVKLQLDPATMAMDLGLVAKAMTANTVCVYASAPTFTHGVVDPIEELAGLCAAKVRAPAAPHTHERERRRGSMNYPARLPPRGGIDAGLPEGSMMLGLLLLLLLMLLLLLLSSC